MHIISYMKEEVRIIRERDPAIKGNMEVFFYPGFWAILVHRISHRLYLKKHYFLARWISQRAARRTGIEIHPGAKVLGSFTVGENAKIGAGAVVLKEVPPNCTVVGVPGRIVKSASLNIPRMTMEQITLPDPVKQDIVHLQQENQILMKRVERLEKRIRWQSGNGYTNIESPAKAAGCRCGNGNAVSF